MKGSEGMRTVRRGARPVRPLDLYLTQGRRRYAEAVLGSRSGAFSIRSTIDTRSLLVVCGGIRGRRRHSDGGGRRQNALYAAVAAVEALGWNVAHTDDESNADATT